MRRRERAAPPVLDAYYRTGAFPEFDPSAWEGDTLYARWEAWLNSQAWADSLTADDLSAWCDHAEALAPPMVGEDWTRTVGVDVRRGGRVVTAGVPQA
ncbi:hypothetical protein KZX06_05875 [Micrococcus sp. EYE_162]|uniref:hypothetical protein n=1 Tax=unclassified Micrococcus TaxID=2620948 RepID=UPI002003280C|nr:MULTISPECIES: hypothetical protein [unclassified Micrococcus]MCK6095489.1 hypothetical protein [Micrococcus sp. EYE_212]MCK6171564.1 hypothetical protein [Micrococcus sp. EYE_162]